MSEQDVDFEALARTHGFVLHAPTRVIGQVKAFYQPGEYFNPVVKQVVQGAVVEFESGHTFAADKTDAFIPLTEKEALYFGGAMDVFTRATASLVELAAKHEIPFLTAAVMLASCLRMQTAMLEARNQIAPPEAVQ